MDYNFKSKSREEPSNVQKDISIAQIKCPQCKKMNPKWRKFCEQCRKSLVFE